MKSVKDIQLAVYANLGMIMEQGENGMCGRIPCQPEPVWLEFIASWAGGWDHVSVKKRYVVTGIIAIPTWDEMCFIKEIFWPDDQHVMQLRPAKADYIDCHPHVLHLWRPQNAEIPKPPKIMV